IVSELNGEKIDVVQWNDTPSTFIANALSPAHIVSVGLNEEEQAATVIVPDKQLSLAIGKEGQNARLAAKLSGWRIDIKSASMAEAEKLEAAKAAPEAAEEEAKAEVEEAIEAVAEGAVPEEIPADLALPGEELELAEEPAAEEAEAEPVKEEILMPPPILLEQQGGDGKPQLRFAEDIMAPRRTKAAAKTTKSKKKKKGAYAKDTGEDGVKARKARRDFTVEEDEEDFE
ncbi:MAG: transcription termination/antitermination protein NusA, partial [Dehalococcoidales bacterium]|nr:transcription termination/antitermination protein NusA [Dehalococcoidales bacterium]